MYAAFCVSIFVTIIRLIACEDECGSPPEPDNVRVSNPSDSGYVEGSTVTYKCDYGYVTGGIVKTSRCVRDPDTDQLVWTTAEVTCNPRSCGDPGFVENSRRVGSRFTFPNNVEYVCNDGYKLSGSRRRFCEASGVWSGRLPSCNIISCGRPEDPENGRAIYTSLEYDSELTYECGKDLQLSSNEPRICGPDGEWTGTKPVCREIECEMPGAPQFGTVELIGNKPKVGSIVIYKCVSGRKLVGSGSSKCLKSGEWTFETPECVEPCEIPAVANGELGKYEEEYQRYRWRTVFKKVSAGTILDENEQVVLKCDTNYVPRTVSLREITITCQRGQLTPEPECLSTKCLGDPPPVENGHAVVRSRNHGYTIWYNCDHGFEKQGVGKVECVYGSWSGNGPACVDTRCDKSTLNYPGLARSEGYVLSGQSFTPICLSGYEITEKSDKRIRCNKRQWTGNLPPCTVAKCRSEDLAGFNGLVLGGSRSLDDGDWIQPTCSEGFEFSNKEDSKMYCREGIWQGNLPPCTPAHCANNPPVPENGRIKSFRGIGHGSRIEYECLPPYVMDGTGTVACDHGQWSGSSPTCKDSRCYLRSLNEKDGIDLTNDGPVNSNRRANIFCIRGYHLRYPEVYCERGGWKTENSLSPCQENECEIKAIRNGKILKEKSVPVKDWFGRQTGTKTIRESAVVGTSEMSGAVLYVECNGQYRFHGDESEEQVKITCRRGQWTPSPVCQLPGKPLETELSEVDEVGDVNPTVLPMDNSKVEKLDNNHSSISGRDPLSANNSLEEGPDDFIVLDNSTENGELPVYTTVNPLCSCKYILKDHVLLAHDGKKLLKYDDEIPSGATIAFYCNSTGYYRLRGPPSLMCPEDCDWHSSQFPSCVSPGDDDVVISLVAIPPGNMKLGPGGVISVIPGTRLDLICRVKNRHNEPVELIIPPGNGIKFSEITARGYFRMVYLLNPALPTNSGKYTCYRNDGAYHTIDIEIEDAECPEIETTKELSISYTPNRKSGGRATFHCFSPYMRDGASFVTCEASGFWSGPPGSCYLPTCSLESLYGIIPEGVVPLVDENIGENVPVGQVLRLGCDEEGRVLTGANTATCSTEGTWNTGDDFRCVQGCAGVQKKNGSVLLIKPNKEIYSMGESITFSCPKGKELTIDVQRVLCFKSGWTPDTIPDCQ